MNQPKAVCALSAYEGSICRSHMLVTLVQRKSLCPAGGAAGLLWWCLGTVTTLTDTVI